MYMCNTLQWAKSFCHKTLQHLWRKKINLYHDCSTFFNIQQNSAKCKNLHRSATFLTITQFLSYLNLLCIGNLFLSQNNNIVYFSPRRITDNVLQLTEESLDSNLSENSLELRFADGVLLPAVYIFETHTHLSVLAATTNSVHRIVFPHPDGLRRHVSCPFCLDPSTIFS